jgi:hypothetical protein
MVETLTDVPRLESRWTMCFALVQHPGVSPRKSSTCAVGTYNFICNKKNHAGEDIRDFTAHEIHRLKEVIE